MDGEGEDGVAAEGDRELKLEVRPSIRLGGGHGAMRVRRGSRVIRVGEGGKEGEYAAITRPARRHDVGFLKLTEYIIAATVAFRCRLRSTMILRSSSGCSDGLHSSSSKFANRS